MREQASINKTAWEHRAYEAWNRSGGGPAEEAAEIKANPRVRRFHVNTERPLILYMLKVE